MDAMRNEHCVRHGHNTSFTTPNYQITTTPEKEWAIVVQGEPPAQEDMRHGRMILDLALARHWASPDDLVLSERNTPSEATAPDAAAARALVKKAGLQRAEVAAVILYTGPMVRARLQPLLPRPTQLIRFTHSLPLLRARPQYDVYNCLLRRFPADRFKDYSDNLFSTTIAVLASAVQKISRVAVIREGTTFYRGLSRRMELPDAFFRPDAMGRRGFAEWGFLSTTSSKEVALAYSYSGDGQADPTTAPMPIIMCISSSAVDRGASISDFSQYPKVPPFPPRNPLVFNSPCPFSLI